MIDFMDFRKSIEARELLDEAYDSVKHNGKLSPESIERIVLFYENYSEYTRLTRLECGCSQYTDENGVERWTKDGAEITSLY